MKQYLYHLIIKSSINSMIVFYNMEMKNYVAASFRGEYFDAYFED